MKTIIPKAISGFNFVLLSGDDGKKPSEKGWTKKERRLEDPVLQKHLDKGFNYGIRCGGTSPIVIDGKSYFLIVVDFDDEKTQTEILPKLPETFTVRSGGKGLFHLYFASDDDKPYSVKNEKLDTLIDVLGEGRQIVGPDSTHKKTGNKYDVVKDVPFEVIPYAELKAILLPYDKSPRKERPIKTESIAIQGDVSSNILCAVSMETVLSELNIDTTKNPTGCPFHSSKGGKCLGWNSETAHCFHCEGSWNKYSLIRDSKKLNDKQTFNWFAEKAGMVEELARSRKMYKVLVRQENTETRNDDFQKIRNEVFVYDNEENILISKTLHNLANYFIENNHVLTFNDTDEIYIYNEGVYSARGEKVIANFSQKVLDDASKNNHINEVLGHIKRLTYVKRDQTVEPKNKICLKNGILNLETLQIESHNPETFFFNKIPVDYNSTADCPQIKKFLSEIVRNEDVSLLQEFAGYCLYKEHFIHKAFMLVGGGANGKSTFITLLKSFLGQENVSAVPLQKLETNRFSISSLFGKLANLFADLPDKSLTGTSMFKMLVGQDLIPAEKKFKDEFSFENYAKFIFSANQIPKSPEDTDAFFRRWIIINFPNQFLANADKKLIKKLTTPIELSGFLNYAIEGLKKLIEHGDFSNTKSLDKVRDQYIRMSDSVQAFVIDHVKTRPDEHVEKKKLYTAYADYCRHMKYPIVSEATFHKELAKKIRVEDFRPRINIDGREERPTCWKGIFVDFKQIGSPHRLDQPDQVDQNSRGQSGQEGQGNTTGLLTIYGKIAALKQDGVREFLDFQIDELGLTKSDLEKGVKLTLLHESSPGRFILM